MRFKTMFQLFNLRRSVKNFIATDVASAALIVILFSSFGAWATPSTFGAEFELTNKILADAPDFIAEKASESLEKQQQIKFIEAIREHCKVAKCIIKEGPGKWDTDYRVIYEDRWWFKVSYDPRCVEITFKPSTIEELSSENLRMRINEDIFGVGQKAGLIPNPADSNHVNIGIRSAFGNDGKKFLRFFVDYANHPDLALGGLGYDINNAPPLSVLSDEQRQALDLIVTEVNDGRLVSVQEVARAIQDLVYTKSFNPDWGGEEHYQAIGLKKVNTTDLRYGDAPMEFRAMWTQKSAEDFTLFSELIQARINFLNQEKGPIVYQKRKTKSFGEYSDVEIKTRLYVYISEAGLDFEKYRKILPGRYKKTELASFLDSSSSFASKLKSLDVYSDLILTSRFVQEKVIEILNNPVNYKKPHRAEFIKSLSKLAEKNQYLKNTDFLFYRFERDVEQNLFRKLSQTSEPYRLRCNFVH